jgi:phage terminase large subunit
MPLWTTTNVFERNMQAYCTPGKRRAINQGGTSSSKTYSILQCLIWIALTFPSKTISVVSETFPHLQKGAIRDFKNILGTNFDESSWHSTNSVYTFPSGSIIEFFSVDDSRKARGPRRDVLFLNEVNNIGYEAYDQLDMRTNEFTFGDYNPVGEFFIHEKGILDDPQNVYIHSTYLDAKEYLPATVVENIESHKDKDPNWWRVYGLGEVGNVEGLVHPYFSLIDSFPVGFDTFYGLDFGFSSDPAALVKCCIINGHLICDELIYEKGLTNDAIARRMDQLGIVKGYDEIWADSAEPKSIMEIHRYGFNIKPVFKAPDSVVTGIQKVNQFKQVWTKRSLNGIKEQRNYRYITDKDGRITNKPIDDFNHLQDARRYACMMKTMGQKGKLLHLGH